MKERYIKQVEKELSLSHKVKKEVVRDLNEVFSSALEHGETEQQVIRRLGTPKEFADSIAEQFGIDNIVRKKRKGFISALIALIIAAAYYRCCCLFDICCYTIPESTGGRNRTGRRDDKYSD